MLGRTAGGMYWMFRYLERSENTARLVEAGLRIALTRASNADAEWESVVTTAGQLDAFLVKHDEVDADTAVDFLLRDLEDPSSVRSVIESARSNAREVRTALTREVWEATNTAWMTLCEALRRPVPHRDLPRVLELIRQESAIVRGALHGTMMRNDAYNFARLGTFIERADSTARILDVKYWVLLPSPTQVGSWLDNVQWETILRSVSAQRAYRWTHPGPVNPMGIADFLILDRRMPRSLAFAFMKIDDNLNYLASTYDQRHECHDRSQQLLRTVSSTSIESVFDHGLHEFLDECVKDTSRLGQQIESDYRFTEG